MPVTIRIQNVQSIRDATLRIDGFTVVTGPNNSGKTASQRAVRGVFTNASPGPLVRHGEPQLTVDLSFDDGNTVRWEKGDKVNRYTVNGKVLSTVGRGVPPEVAALGVMEIRAGSDRLWPQIAEQFGGVLFLVDRSGSVVAEALSDVDKVGRLTDALRLAESDRRTANTQLKIRRSDVEKAKEELDFFKGLPTVAEQVAQVEALSKQVDTLADQLSDLQALVRQRSAALQEIAALQNAPVHVVPSADQISALREVRSQVDTASGLFQRLQRLQTLNNTLAPIENVSVPSSDQVVSLSAEIRGQNSLWANLQNRRSAVQHLEGAGTLAASTKIPTAEVFERLRKVQTIVGDMASLAHRRTIAANTLRQLEVDLHKKQSEHTLSVNALREVLGGVGECPLCHAACEHDNEVGVSASLHG